MATLKTKAGTTSVTAFLESIQNTRQREDCFWLLEFMKKSTGEEPVIWGNGMVGFGSYHYKYSSGREGDWFVTGFSPRKKDITLYFSAGLHTMQFLVEKLGKVKTGKSCVYITNLEQIDKDVLKQMIRHNEHTLKKILEEFK
jgi:hypothetical protein